MSSPTGSLHTSFPVCILLSQPILTTVHVQQEETTEDLIQAVTGVYGLCCSHLVHIQKGKNLLLLLTLLHLHCAAVSFCPPHLSSPLVSPCLAYLFSSFISSCLQTHSPPTPLFCAYLHLSQSPLSQLSLLFFIFSSLLCIPLSLALSLPPLPNPLLSNTRFSSHQPLSALLSPT